MRRAKIVCTLGPASREPAFIGHLMDEGMNVARINFSHGEAADHAASVAAVRQQADLRGRPVAVLQDLQGPKIRVGRFANGQVELETGAEFVVTTRAVTGDTEQVSTTYAELPRDVQAGDVLLLDDGLLSLEVVEVEGPDIHTRVAVGGTLKNNKGINLPGVQVSAPALTDKDRRDLQVGLELGVDFIALSFVRSPDDVREAVRLATRADGSRVPVIAKIEKPQAVERLDAIIDVADGIMVARGDLGVELGAEKVPLIQKRCIDETNARGKIVITATQMLESMIANPRPTRAEASDVANAVLDGTDALMLSGETATGKYPLLAVRTMARIIEEIECSARFKSRFDTATLDFSFTANAIAKSAVVAARQLGATAIACVTESGGVARLMSEYRPESALIAFTTRPEVYRQLALYWGVESMMAPRCGSFDELVSAVNRALVQSGVCKPGDLGVIATAVPYGSGQSANTLHIHRVDG
jgi:pyruvate kinase